MKINTNSTILFSRLIKLKFVVGLFMLVMHTSCSTKNPDSIIEAFINSYVTDTREEVFSVEVLPHSRHVFILKGFIESNEHHDRLLQSFHKNNITIVDSIEILPCNNITEPWALVNLSVANIRKTPSHRSELVSQALMGTPVRVLKENKNWLYVQTPDKYLGWIEKAAIEFYSEKQLQNWKTANRLIMHAPFAQAYCTDTHQPVSDMVAGAIIVKTASKGADIIVELPDGQLALMKKDYFLPFDAWLAFKLTEKQQLVQTAMSMNGIPYLWGGTSNKGIDCSGFTKMIYYLNGILISRDASLQIRHGKEIPINQGWELFETGDLLFFSANIDDDCNRITHVGMYIGDSNYIHAAGRVKTNSIDSTRNNYGEYHGPRFKAVRRIIGMEDTQNITRVKNHEWY